MRKHWLTIAEIGIAVVGLVAWILSSNVLVAIVAALLMFAFGVTKPILDARKSARSQRYVQQQFDRAEAHLVGETENLLADLPEPTPPPER